MSIGLDEDGRPVHYPANPNKFEFDSEVSAIFGNIATRSIPNYLEAHASHVRMLRQWMKPGVKILDVGASRGAFIGRVIAEYPALWKTDEVEIDAIDSSPDMCAYLHRDFPNVRVMNLDISSSQFLDRPQPQYDVICVNYVLQFIEPAKQLRLLHRLSDMVRLGGVLILGHKAQHYGTAGELSNEEYIRFRMDNGYTREEIEAKTKALQGSMWPMNHYDLLTILRSSFSEVAETFRFMQFVNLFAVK